MCPPHENFSLPSQNYCSLSTYTLRGGSFLSRLWAMVFMILLFMVGLSVGTQEKKVIHASEVEAKIKNGEPANFDNCTIVDNLNLSRLIIEGTVYFFNQTTFQDSVNFNYTTINGVTLHFEHSTFNGDAYFEHSTFNGDAHFEHSTFNGDAHFEHSTFRTYAIFWKSIFNGDADFSYSIFSFVVDFVGSVFSGDAEFGFSTFNNSATFSNSTFSGIADFGYSTFSDEASFSYSKFKGHAFYYNSNFNDLVSFDYSIFSSDADFGSTTFSGNTFFYNSKFKGNAFFIGTTLKKKLDLTSAEYDKNIYIRWSEDNILAYDDTAYHLLIENLKDLGFMTDADNCYYQFRVDQFRHLNPLKEPFLFIFNFGAWVFYGFGKKPIYPVIWSVVSIGLFGLFWLAIGLSNSKEGINKYYFGNVWYSVAFLSFIRYVVGSKKSMDAVYEYDQAGNWPAGIKEALCFSATVFLAGTKLFVDPPEVPYAPANSQSTIKFAFTLERVLGAFFSILFFVAISGTVVR
jgi:hypothetical protein